MVGDRSSAAARIAAISYRLYLGMVAGFLILPVLVVIAVSFDDAPYVKFPPTSFTLRWYVDQLAEPSIRLALWNSVVVGISCTLLSVGIAVPASLVLAKRRFLGRTAIYTLIMSPLTVPWIVIGLAILFLWGALDLALDLGTLIAGHTIIGIPYVLRTCMAVLASIDPAYERAARNLGASRARTFCTVTLPMMKGGILAGASFVLLISFTNVPVSLFVTTADTITLPISIFSYMLSNFDPGVAVIATLQLVVVVIGLLVAQKIANAKDFLL